MVELDGVAIILRKFVMEVVVTFAHGDDSSDEMVSGSAFIIERLVTKIVGKGVDTECGVMDQDETKYCRVVESALDNSKLRGNIYTVS